MAEAMKAIGWLTVLTGFLAGVVGPIVLFRNGTWEPRGINAFWGGDLQSEWIGVNKLANFVRDPSCEHRRRLPRHHGSREGRPLTEPRLTCFIAAGLVLW
ncbi:hypothetical protein JQ586_33205 [Bradyrhizobium jicamae]|nr:hypothetical protein [Bradyrhizobium jicamae]